MEQIELKAITREILGKKVRFLRRQGITPVHLFGHGVDSAALQCDTAQLRRALAQARKTKLISLQVDGAERPRNVLAREVQTDPRTGGLLHADFYQVRMTEVVKVEVPIDLVGEAPALTFKDNMLVQELSSLTIECLPDEIPDKVELDLGSLAEAGQVIRVKGIKVDGGVAVLNDPEHIVVKVSAQPRAMVEEEAVEEETVAHEATPSTEDE